MPRIVENIVFNPGPQTYSSATLKVYGFTLLEVMIVMGLMSITTLAMTGLMASVAKNQTSMILRTTRTQLISRFSTLLNDPNSIYISAGETAISPVTQAVQSSLFACIGNFPTGGCTQTYPCLANTYQYNYQEACVPTAMQTAGTCGKPCALSACGGLPLAQCPTTGVWVPNSITTQASVSNYLDASQKAFCIWVGAQCVELTTNAQMQTYSTCPTSTTTTGLASGGTAFTLYDQNNIAVPEYYDQNGASLGQSSTNYAFQVIPYFYGAATSDLNSTVYLYFVITVSTTNPVIANSGVQGFTSPAYSFSTPLNLLSATTTSMCTSLGGTMNGSTCQLPVPYMNIFTSSGTFIPTQTGTYRVTVVGGGGSGGNTPNSSWPSGGGGGGAGGTAIYTVQLIQGLSYSYVVGCGSCSGMFNLWGKNSTFTDGATTVIGGLGSPGNSPAGGAGGTASGGQINITGASGVNGSSGDSGQYNGGGGQGGSSRGTSIYGVGGAGAPNCYQVVNGSPGSGYGAGGGGSCGDNNSYNASGSNGVVIIEGPF